MIKVLIVDDHQIVIDGLQLLLEGLEDITCVGISNSGSDALKFLVSNEVDLVILDIEMPEMDGIECCSRIRSHLLPRKIIFCLFHEPFPPRSITRVRKA